MTVEKDPADMSADEASDLKLRRETDKERSTRVAKAWERTMQSPDGRAVVWDIIGRTGAYETPLRHDPHATYHAIGRGDFGRELYATMAHEYPALFTIMIRENAK